MCIRDRSFAKQYLARQKLASSLSRETEKHGATVRNTMSMLDPGKLSKFLWGNIFYNLETRKFIKVSSKDPDETPRSFVHFVLEPFYKLICLTLTSDKMAL